jgi:dTDP-4-dehydrorhamnose 3,5-epimerase-like enzyme
MVDLWRLKILTDDDMGDRIWSVLMDPELRPEQVYLTAAIPHSRKGPHLHMKRRGVFICIQGNVRIVRKIDWGVTYEMHEEITGEDHDYARVVVPPGIETAIYNDGDEEALVLNMPAPAWSKEEPDEWPIKDQGCWK